MPHIDLKNNLPGILGPLAFRPETAGPLSALAEVLLRGDNTLSRGERELIAAYVSFLNGCHFCQEAHGSAAQYYLECDKEFIDAVETDFISSGVSDKMKVLLWIAASVKKGGKFVDQNQVDTAKSLGITDTEIHDTVLIAAAFCMYTRYVDGLATWAPQEPGFYSSRAKQRAEEGYASVNLANK
jgi:uncharacterized peroxidase-related enzyme